MTPIKTGWAKHYDLDLPGQSPGWLAAGRRPAKRMTRRCRKRKAGKNCASPSGGMAKV